MAEPLRRSLRLVPLAVYGVGTMVGAGIYSVIGVAAGEAGSNLWLAFALAGVAAFLTALSYAELSSLEPRAGAEYQFLKLAFPERRLLAFLAGYLIALNAAAAAATVSVAFAGYLRAFVEVPVLPTAFALLAACTLVNIAGIREATWLSMGLIAVEVSGLIAVVLAAGLEGEAERAFSGLPSAGELGGILRSAALIFFVFLGFEDVANLSEETHDPTHTVPRALLASIGITSLLYVAVALSVVALASPTELARSESPLRVAATAAFPGLGNGVALAALVATASTALIVLVSISRLLFGMARDGDMPAPLARTLRTRQTPWVAALALSAAACLLLPLRSVRTLASVSSLGVLLVFIAVHASLIRLRYRQPDRPRPFRVPGTLGGLPIIPSLGIALSLALATQFAPLVYAISITAVLAGLLLFHLRSAAC